MNYGKGAVTPSAAGVALLPFTGNNTVLFIIAASLIGLGVVVLAVSLFLAKKANRQTSTN